FIDAVTFTVVGRPNTFGSIIAICLPRQLAFWKDIFLLVLKLHFLVRLHSHYVDCPKEGYCAPYGYYWNWPTMGWLSASLRHQTEYILGLPYLGFLHKNVSLAIYHF